MMPDTLQGAPSTAISLFTFQPVRRATPSPIMQSSEPSFAHRPLTCQTGLTT